MDQDTDSHLVDFLRRKLLDSRKSLDEACETLQLFNPTSFARNGFPPTEPGAASVLLAVEARGRQQASDNFQHDHAMPPPVPRPSIFCLDIIEMEGKVKAQLIDQMSLPLESQVSIDTLTQNALLTLVTERWTWTTQWYFETLGLEKLTPITRYHISPTVENYQALQPQFRPTALQLTKFHWPIIDWNPFPSLRDKMIEHANEINLNEVILSSMQSFCMEVECIETSPRPPPVQSGATGQHRYYRLEEYLNYISEQDRSSHTDLVGQQPLQISKSIEAKFILTLRSMDACYKLEPSFFERFPMLYCEEAAVKGTYASIYDLESY